MKIQKLKITYGKVRTGTLSVTDPRGKNQRLAS